MPPFRPTLREQEQAAWDLYAAHALAAYIEKDWATPTNIHGELIDPVEYAANKADALLELRQAKFRKPK